MSDMYVLGTYPDFEASLKFTLPEEGGYSNDAHDPGGMTMKGIIQREYDSWRKRHGLPTQWVKKISDDEMRTIYCNEYWLPHCPLVPRGLDLCLFDTNVNNGVHAGMVLLQRALQVHDDGLWGPETEGAVNVLRAPASELHDVIVLFYQKRKAYYQSLRNFRYFDTDWLRRDLHMEQAALKLIEGEAQV
jgi:lysozyme family protein